MPRARGANAVMHAAFESAYGTPPAAGYRLMPFVSSNLGAEQGLIESDLLGQGRAPADPTYDVTNNDGDVVVPLDTQAFGIWLKLLLGAPTSADFDGRRAHTFRTGLPVLPSQSVEIGLKDVSSFTTNYGMRANTLQIQMQRAGLVNATLGLIGKGETVPANVSQAGSPTGWPANKRFANATGRIELDGVPVGEVVSAQLSFSNALDKDETIKPDGEINDVDPGMPTLALTLTTKFADASLYNKATSQTPVAVKLVWQVGTVSLSFEVPRVWLPRVKRPITGPAGIQAQFNAVGSSAAGVPLMTAVLINDVEGYA